MRESFGLILLLLFCISPLIWYLATEKKRTARYAAQKAAAQAAVPPLQHCMTCGNEFRPAPGAMRGSTFVEVVLWLCTFGVIRLLYSIGRRMGIGKAKLMCPACSSNQVVPATTPRRTRTPPAAGAPARLHKLSLRTPTHWAARPGPAMSA